jgi:hypothetical protein
MTIAMLLANTIQAVNQSIEDWSGFLRLDQSSI